MGVQIGPVSNIDCGPSGDDIAESVNIVVTVELVRAPYKATLVEHHPCVSAPVSVWRARADRAVSLIGEALAKLREEPIGGAVE